MKDKVEGCLCGQGLNRRHVIAGGAAAVAGILGAGAALADPSEDRPQPGDVFVLEEDDSKKPVRADAIKAGEPQVLVWPMDPASGVVRSGSRLNKVMLLRLDPATLIDATKDRAADGIVAYSAICQHAGCEVVNWIDSPGVLECPCHNSQYDPRDAARVLDGPTPKVLPALPLKLVDGVLVAAATFTGKVGFSQA